MIMIGVDLGHCETCAAISNAFGDNKYEVKRLNVDQHDNLMPTQLMLTNEQMRKLKGVANPDAAFLASLGEIKIGDKLPLLDEQDDGEVFAYFKACPDQFNEPYGSGSVSKACGITRGQLLACFAYTLISNIIRYNPDKFQGVSLKEIGLMVGCPTTEKWTSPQNRAKYAALIGRASGVKMVKIEPESRAALFSAVEGEDKTVSAKDGVLVFDFGSSTADCTYMKLGDKCLEFSWDLGAVWIERTMVTLGIRKGMQAGAFSSVPNDLKIRNEVNTFRRIKESYFSGEYGKMGKSFIICDEHMVKVNDDYINSVINEPIVINCNGKSRTKTGSWRELCRGFFETAQKMLTEFDTDAECIVITGGASHMRFIYDCCREVFSNIPAEKIYIEDNPSFTVSTGLEWINISNEGYDKCVQNAQRAVMQNTSTNTSSLKGKIAKETSDYLKPQLQRILEAWQSKPDPLTRRMLSNDIQSFLNSPSTKKKNEEISQKALNNWKYELSKKMLSAVENEIKNIYSDSVARGLEIPDTLWNKLQSANSNTSKTIEGLIGSMKIDNAVVEGLKTLGAIVTGIVGLPFAILDAFLGTNMADFFENLLDRIDNAHTNQDMDKPLGWMAKRSVIKAHNNLIGNLQVTLAKSMDESFKTVDKEYPEMVSSILKNAFDISMLKPESFKVNKMYENY